MNPEQYGHLYRLILLLIVLAALLLPPLVRKIRERRRPRKGLRIVD